MEVPERLIGGLRCPLALGRTAGPHEQRQIDRPERHQVSRRSGRVLTGQPAICCGDQSSPSLARPQVR